MIRVFIFCLLVASSCKNDEVKYFNNDKWKIPGSYNYTALKEKPKEVKESLYLDLSDTTINASGRLNNYDLWKFDNDGNLIYRKYSSNSDSFCVITEIIYDQNGAQSKTFTNNDSLHTKEDGGRVVSELLSNSKFLRKSYSPGKPKFSLISFEDNGGIIKNEIIEDTINLNNVVQTQLTYYKNNVIQKIETLNDIHKKVQNYFYSKDSFLDSMIINENGRLSSKEIYFNNQHGDVTKYLEIGSNNDTTIIAFLQYQYDQHGNWTKQLEKRNDRDNYNLMLENTASKYSLIVREIKY